MQIDAPRKLFTVDEYHQMAKVGVLDPGERVDLLAAGPGGAAVDRLLTIARSELAASTVAQGAAAPAVLEHAEGG